MEINGTIYRILQNQEVTFGDGTKKVKGGFVIMREGDYPKPVRVSFYAESREGKDGKYYTTLRCTNIMHLMAASNMPPAAYSWSPNGDTVSTQNQEPTALPKEHDLPLEDEQVPF